MPYAIGLVKPIARSFFWTAPCRGIEPRPVGFGDQPAPSAQDLWVVLLWTGLTWGYPWSGPTASQIWLNQCWADFKPLAGASKAGTSPVISAS